MTVQGFHLTLSRMTAMDVTASTLDGLTASLSEGFYTTFSTLSGGTRVLGLTAHLKRLYEPAQNLGLHPSVDSKKLREYIAELTRQSLPNESRLRLILTKDTGDVYIGVQPFVPTPETVYRDGVHVITREMARHDPRIKGTDFIAQSAEQRKLVKDDIYEILLVRHGKILEGMTSNFYAINGKTLITAQKGILLGVTRRAVLHLARGQGMSIEYRSPHVDEKFNEAFLTSSSRGVVPIVKIDGKPVGQGSPGVWTNTLSLAYQAYVQERSEAII
ncbi:MAG: aminotransferase class IV family protein [Anaerolineae bacterium]|nr:aminotransferase class IV family protein [Anaerolineae bacterium]